MYYDTCVMVIMKYIVNDTVILIGILIVMVIMNSMGIVMVKMTGIFKVMLTI